MKANKTAREESLKAAPLTIVILAAFMLGLTGCTGAGSSSPEAGNVIADSVSNGGTRFASIQKTQGINVGESNSIWTVGMIKNNAQSLILDVERISLTVGENYAKMAWTIPVAGNLADSFTGTRTFLSEWGFLIGRGSNSTGDIGLFVVDHLLNKYQLIFSATNGAAGARASVFSYKARGTDGKDYNFIAIAYHDNGSNIRIERFLVNEGASDLTSRFTRVKPYSTPAGNLTSNAAVYSGFLYPNCGNNGCQPIFFGNFTTQVQGFDMTVDVPPTPFTNAAATIATTTKTQPNVNFKSTSHPPGGPFGSVNDYVYSMAGDPNDGYVYLAEDQSNSVNNSHVAYDRTNQIVFRFGRESKIGPTGINNNNNPQPVITAWKRGCFFDDAMKDCNPMTTPHSRIFSDVGENVGPASDLGNGCVAVLGWKRPSEAGANDFKPGVYTACIRDPNDLDKGLSVTKVGEVNGATYMYNDFTGAYQSDRPVQVLFDLKAQKLDGTKSVRFLWVPKVGFSNTMTGLNIGVRCYSKANILTPPPFQPYANFPPGVTMTEIPGCAGPSTNMVEFQFTRIPKQRFTRFDSITVTATPL